MCTTLNFQSSIIKPIVDGELRPDAERAVARLAVFASFFDDSASSELAPSSSSSSLLLADPTAAPPVVVDNVVVVVVVSAAALFADGVVIAEAKRSTNARGPARNSLRRRSSERALRSAPFSLNTFT